MTSWFQVTGPAAAPPRSAARVRLRLSPGGARRPWRFSLALSLSLVFHALAAVLLFFPRPSPRSGKVVVVSLTLRPLSGPPPTLRVPFPRPLTLGSVPEHRRDAPPAARRRTASSPTSAALPQGAAKTAAEPAGQEASSPQGNEVPLAPASASGPAGPEEVPKAGGEGALEMLRGGDGGEGSGPGGSGAGRGGGGGGNGSGSGGSDRGGGGASGLPPAPAPILAGVAGKRSGGHSSTRRAPAGPAGREPPSSPSSSSKTGGIAGLRVARSSGVEVLDEEAISAVERAAPFAPPGMAVLLSIPVSFRAR